MKRWRRFNSFMLFGVFLLLYIILCLYALIFKAVPPLELLSTGRDCFRTVNLIPFHTIYSYLSGAQDVSPIIAVNNILGNIILFVPLGIYLQLWKRKRGVLRCMRTVFLVTLSVELLQFLFGLGAADIDDIILNCLGGLAGILIYRGLSALLKEEEKVRSAIVLGGLLTMFLPVVVILHLGLRFRLG